jgi:hypothetical protein
MRDFPLVGCLQIDFWNFCRSYCRRYKHHRQTVLRQTREGGGLIEITGFLLVHWRTHQQEHQWMLHKRMLNMMISWWLRHQSSQRLSWAHYVNLLYYVFVSRKILSLFHLCIGFSESEFCFAYETREENSILDFLCTNQPHTILLDFKFQFWQLGSGGKLFMSLAKWPQLCFCIVLKRSPFAVGSWQNLPVATGKPPNGDMIHHRNGLT